MDENKEIPELITTKVAEGLAALAPRLRSWVRDHLISPRKVLLSVDPDGTSFEDFWLITDNVGKEDANYRLVYDETEQSFGLECTLDTGVEWYMGNYGSLSEAIENM